MKIDLFTGLVPYLGQEVITHRERLYDLLTGKMSASLRQSTVLSYYLRYAGVRGYLNELAKHNNYQDNLVDVFVLACKNLIEEYRDVVLLKAQGAKYLMTSRHIMYLAFSKGSEPKDWKGATFIC